MQEKIKTVPFSLIDIKSKLHTHDQLIADLHQALSEVGRDIHKMKNIILQQEKLIQKLKNRVYFNEQSD